MNPQEQGEQKRWRMISHKTWCHSKSCEGQCSGNIGRCSNCENLEEQLTQLQSENARLLSEIENLFDKIKHGDSEHQEWLKKAIAVHFSQGAGEIKECCPYSGHKSGALRCMCQEKKAL